MNTYYIKSRIPCWVDFYTKVEAENEADAFEVFRDSGGMGVGYDVGDTVDGMPETDELVSELPGGLVLYEDLQHTPLDCVQFGDDGLPNFGGHGGVS
jgi:hypothetical protein